MIFLNLFKRFGVFSLLFAVLFSSQIVLAAPIKVVDVVADTFSPLILRSDGTVFKVASDGGRFITELGNDNKSIHGGGETYFVVKNNGDIWSACGMEECNLIGRGNITNSLDQSQNLSNWGKIEGISNVKEVESRGLTTFVIDGGGDLWGWGLNVDYWTTPPAILDSTVPIKFTGKQLASGVFPGGISDISISALSSIAITSGGDIYTWDTTTFPSIKNNMPAGKTFNRVFATGHSFFALTEANELYGWGDNAFGQLLNPDAQTGAPIDIPVLATQTGLVSGEHFSNIISDDQGILALSSSGNVFAWGLNNSDGVLGTGNSENVSTPVKLRDQNGEYLSSIVKIDKESLAVFALRGDGQVFAWGMHSTGNPADNVPTIFTRTFYMIYNPPSNNSPGNNLTGPLPRTGLNMALYLFASVVAVFTGVVLYRRFQSR